jgi:hypothetical protein
MGIVLSTIFPLLRSSGVIYFPLQQIRSSSPLPAVSGRLCLQSYNNEMSGLQRGVGGLKLLGGKGHRAES